MARNGNRTRDQSKHASSKSSQKYRAADREVRKIGREIRAGVANETEKGVRARGDSTSQPWWKADDAMLAEHPRWVRNKSKEESKALGALTSRISNAAVEAAQFVVAGWTGPIEWSFIRLLTIHSFYAALANSRGMLVRPAWIAEPALSPLGAEGLLQAINALPLDELGPEHLGAVQETLMGYGLAEGAVVPTRGRRKGGIHFTPYDLALHVTLTTLSPLLRIVPPEKTLDLRLCDPAVGGGVFLIACVRVLAPRVLRAGLAKTLDEAKRLVAIRCCYGVDVKIPAVMTAGLALTLECRADRMPSDWLEDNIKHGDALVGINLEQLEKFYWKKDGDPGPDFDIRPLIDQAMAQGVAARHARIESLSRAAV